jgi:hypothetical protein
MRKDAAHPFGDGDLEALHEPVTVFVEGITSASCCHGISEVQGKASGTDACPPTCNSFTNATVNDRQILLATTSRSTAYVEIANDDQSSPTSLLLVSAQNELICAMLPVEEVSPERS